MRNKKRALLLLAVLLFTSITVVISQSEYLFKPTFWKDLAVSAPDIREIASTDSPERIPKIFHHTWKSPEIPARWQDSYEACKRMYPDFKFILWTDEEAEKFIKTNNPSFLQEFQSYPYPIQRADAIRYFILYHIGGVYADLDVGCSPTNRIEPLLKLDAFIPKTKPMGFSNDLLGSRPNHPFFKQLIDNLHTWDHWYVVPYATVFFSTGPMYLNIQFGMYNQKIPVYVLMPDVYSDGSTKLFRHLPGSTWHSWDAHLLKSVWRIKYHAITLLISGYLIYRFSKRLVANTKSV